MPDQWERHGKSDDWDSLGSRKQTRAAAANDDPVHDKVPGKKNPDWCKQAPDHRHIMMMERQSWVHRSKCGWDAQWDRHEHKMVPGFYCVHEYVCEYCGKKFGGVPAEYCPEYTRNIPDYAMVRVEEATQRRARWMPRRLVKGPTHYRKPKANP